MSKIVFGKIVLIFVLVPLADLMLLMWLSARTGWAFSVALVVASGILGAWLAKWQSTMVRSEIAQRMQQNQMSAGLLTDGAMIFFAAGLLLTPGFITDAVGLSLLIPGCRKWYKLKLSGWVKRHFKLQTFGTSAPGSSPFEPGDPNVLEGEVVHRSTTDPESSQSSSAGIHP